MAGVAARWRPAAASAWRATWLSRLVVWAAGVAGVVAFGVEDAATGFDAAGLTRPFGDVADVLVAPGARWDAVWFLRIAEDGYDAHRAAFFPLYPALVKLAGALVGSPLLGGILVSVACLLAALAALHRLVALDHGEDVARLTVLLVACFPGALFFSAVYSEALFLALSVGAVYAARTDRWAAVGVLGCLAATTRSAGMVLLVPLAVLWWQGGRRTADLAWLALVPAGLVAYCAALAAGGHDALAPFHAQDAWNRVFAGPFGGVPDAVSAAWEGTRAIAAGGPRPVAASFDWAWLNIGLLACLAGVAVALAGAVRRLPAAYWLYAVVALALPLSFPVESQPLMSLPRFVAVLWPLHLWLALRLTGRSRGMRRAVIAASLAGLALVSAEVSTWGWVA